MYIYIVGLYDILKRPFCLRLALECWAHAFRSCDTWTGAHRILILKLTRNDYVQKYLAVLIIVHVSLCLQAGGI